jgi:hypothetical protein
MRFVAKSRPHRLEARAAKLARFWLACLAVLASCADAVLTPALQRRLPILDLPASHLRRFVGALVLLCALEQFAASGRRARHPEALRGKFRACLRTCVQPMLAGGVTLAAIARLARNPEAAIARLVKRLALGFTRRRGPLDLAAIYACDSAALNSLVRAALPFNAGIAAADTS